MEHFDLPEEMVATPQELASCCADLARQTHFGFDTEFVGEDTYHPSLCLIQVALDDRLLVIDPVTTGPLDEFWKLVVDPSRQSIVHAGREEIRLCHYWTGQTPGNLFDLQIAAGLVGMSYPIGHGALVNQLLGIQIAKAETLTEWRDRPLSPQQLRYAFDDVRYLLPLWRRLADRLDRLQRGEWLREEIARLSSNVLPQERVQERWRKLRGLGSLDRRRLAIVRALSHWREDAAARSNRPARTIVRDDLLVEIARRSPSRERDLQTVRGLARRYLPEIVETVQRARDLPLEACPSATERDNDPAQLGMAAGILTAVLGDYCARNQIAPNLVANSQDVKLLVRARFQGADVPEDSMLAQGWRKEFVLPHLMSVLEGRSTVRVSDLQSDAPLTVADCNQDS